MGVHILYRAQAFGPGSQLWFIASHKIEKNQSQVMTSPFISKMDWYLNFQLTRAHLHVSRSYASELKSILNENQIPDFGVDKQTQTPLMVMAKEQFPTTAIIDIPLPDAKEEWPKLIHKTWSSLETPTLRVFLPPEITADEFEAHWPKQKEYEMTVVPA